MSRLKFAPAICIVVSFANAVLGGEQAVTNQTLRLALTLTDGSKVIGTPRIASIRVQTSYAKMEIPLMQIRNIKIEPDHETASLALANGDQLKGILTLKLIELDTAFGSVEVPLKHISGISVYQGGKGSLADILQDGLVLYYSFDKDEGDKVTDASGKGHDGKVQGAAWTPQGKIGGAYSFDGSNDKIVIAGWQPTIGNHNFCVSAWFKTTSGEEQCIVMWGNPYAGGKPMAEVETTGVGGMRGQAGFNNGGPGTITTSSAYNDGNWHNVVTAYDSVSGDTRIYVDGSLQTRGINNLNIASGDLYIGYRNLLNDSSFNGSIDEVCIYDRALSADEIKTLYNSQE